MQPQAFLASRLSLEDLRHRIWEQGKRSGTPIWLSNIDAKDQFAGKQLDYIQLACLKQVRSAPRFICLLDGTFGTTWNEGEVSILELELATAAFSERDIWIFLLAPFDNPDHRIESLLRAVTAACPAARIQGPLSHNQVCDEIARLLEPREQNPETLRVGSFVQDLARNRTPLFNFDLNLRDVQFLNGRFAPLFHHIPDKDRIARLIMQADAETVIPDRLAKLWIAIRHLSAAPFFEKRHEEYLPLWESALGKWSSASAWYALHGHLLLGRLAAVNTLSMIRRRMPEVLQRGLGPPSIFANAGAAASEYYSMAKLVPSKATRYWLLTKAMWNCNAALRARVTSDVSGLLDIRGHVKLSMMNAVGGFSDLKRALAIRQDQGQSAACIGESEVHLGRAYAYCASRLPRMIGSVHLDQRAERLLQEGLAKLQTTDNYPFIVQGLKHLGDFYAGVNRRREAIDTLRKAEAIASDKEIRGQLRGVQEQLRKLGESPLSKN